jgi:hypothetical protein
MILRKRLAQPLAAATQKNLAVCGCGLNSRNTCSAFVDLDQQYRN